jgi:hypothetical protein
MTHSPDYLAGRADGRADGRAEALEEAAECCLEYAEAHDTNEAALQIHLDMARGAIECAAAIRALKETPR